MPTDVPKHGIQRPRPQRPVIRDGDVVLAALVGRQPHVVAGLANEAVADPTEGARQGSTIEQFLGNRVNHRPQHPTTIS